MLSSVIDRVMDAGVIVSVIVGFTVMLALPILLSLLMGGPLYLFSKLFGGGGSIGGDR